MALSQTLDDSPLRLGQRPSAADAVNLQEVYNERHRLALEELLSGGVENFLDFLKREKIPNFLSDDEIQRIRSAAVPPPRCVSVHGEELEQSLGSSLDCSSVTYFPEVSDVEPPLLEIGWPAFTAGSYRGVTRAVAHFQPSYGETIYACKEAARRMIKSAKEVIAIVTDSLTDLDIFRDLQEACSHRRVPVYILLDQSCAPAFLRMCRNVGVRLDDLRQMRVRTVAGTTYYMRSGARITGKVHERFMLIDGNRVATGSYRFNWTDGKLNSSNLIELSGQITEKFDEEFRILYAQSQPINARGPQSVRGSGVLEHLSIKHLATCSPRMSREKPTEPVHLTSTPSQRHAEKDAASPTAASRHISTQTSHSVTDGDTQTDAQGLGPTSTAKTPQQDRSPKQIPAPHADPDISLKDAFHELSKERRSHYSAIRSKLEHMVTSLTERRELADVTNVTQGVGAARSSRQRNHKDTNPGPPAESGGMGTWPRARCVH
uniref:Scaffolding anchor of CK1 domain-containing protein n=1 Tax=Poecilia mexicana TaxID=48701 RepID=A0A3B3XW94_9TELE